MHTRFAATAKPYATTPFSLHLVQAPLYDTPEADAGSGDGAGASGDVSSAAGAGSGYSLNDDSMVIVEPGKPAVRWGDYRSSTYVPKAQFEDGKSFLMREAERLDKERQELNRSRQAQPKAQPSAPQVDLLEALESQPVVSGKEVAKIVRALQANGMTPIAQLLATQHAELQQLKQQFGDTQKTTGTLANQQNEAQFQSYIGSTIKQLPELKGLGPVPDDPIIRDILEDVWRSHDQNDPNLPREFKQMAEKRIAGLFDVFKKMQAAAVQKAKDTKRSFFDPQKGQGAGGGKQPYKHLTGDQLAEQFFASDTNT